MKKTTLLLLFIIAFSITAMAQERIEITEMEMVNLGDGQQYATQKDEAKTPLNGKYRIITGYTTEYIDAGFKNGYADGKWEYYKDNILMNLVTYADGYVTGDVISYYPDGEVKSKSEMLKGKANGTIVRYHSNGKKEYEASMKNGSNNGAERWFLEDGMLREETIYKDGKAEGKAFAHVNVGSSNEYKITRAYKNGQLDGTYSEVYTDGQAKTTGKYANGKKEGVWEYFKANGDRAKPTEEYKNDDLVKRTTYYTNGEVEMIREMKNGRQHGIEKKYALNGDLKSEKNFVDGKQVGKQMVYMTSNQANYIETTNYNAKGKKEGEYTQVYEESKKTKVKGQYLNDQKDGKWMFYNMAGKLEKEEVYEKGQLKSSTRVHN